MAERRVEELLLRVSSALERAGVPYCVVGGNAVAAWVARVDDGAVRATKDIDLLVRRSDLSPIRAAADEIGFDLDSAGEIYALLDRTDPRSSRGVHLVFAGEKIRSFRPRPAPNVDEFVLSDAGYRVLNLVPLVVMKLDAGRRIDLVHIEDLLRTGLIDVALAKSLPPDLGPKVLDIAASMDWGDQPNPFQPR